MRVDETSDGQQVALHVNQQLDICLPENRVAGYRWVLASTAGGPCALIGDAYEPPDGPPGRPGLRRWTFKATQPGQERIDLAYVRPWQQDQPPARTFTLHVQVSG
jgi:inhibitor of cysteine peptidase